MSDVIVYIDRSQVRPGRRAELDRGVEQLVEFVAARQPQLLSYGFHFVGDDMTVVGVHPDARSLERHLEVGAPEFAKLAEFIDLRAIDVYGEPTPTVLAQLPPGWKPSPARLEGFLALAPRHIRWCIEMREREWLRDDILEILRRHNAALCIHDLIRPHPIILTTDWTYLRFHGPHAGRKYTGTHSAATLRRKLPPEHQRFEQRHEPLVALRPQIGLAVLRRDQAHFGLLHRLHHRGMAVIVAEHADAQVDLVRSGVGTERPDQAKQRVGGLGDQRTERHENSRRRRGCRL